MRPRLAVVTRREHFVRQLSPAAHNTLVREATAVVVRSLACACIFRHVIAF